MFIIQDKTTYGQGIADEVQKAFVKMGGTVVAYEGITPGESDFNAVLNKVASMKPDVLFFGGMYPEGGLLVKQMKEKQIAAKFIGPDGLENSDFVKIGGDAVIGQYYTSMCADISKTSEGAAWIKAYKEKFSRDPEAWAVYGYDSMGVVLDALKKVATENTGKKPTREQLTKAIRATSGYKGIATNVTFDKRGDNVDALMYVYGYNEAKYPATLINTVEAKGYLKP
jgi:branched-chain amino acid transport system substrate-binding protein